MISFEDEVLMSDEEIMFADYEEQFLVITESSI